MKKIKVGVIGVGYLGKFHAEKYASMEGVDLVGVVDVIPETAAAIAEKFNTKMFTDYHELLDKVDAVSVVVPTTDHFDVSKACLEKGVDILIEKPMTVTLAEADELIAMADKRDQILQVGHLERFNPAVLAMEQHLTRPMFIESHRISVFKGRGIDVDVVLDLMIHDIDIVLSVVDSPIKTIHTVGVPVVTPSTDIANARLIFENGCTANVTVSRISMDNIRRFRIFQPGSYISVDFAKKEIMVINVDESRIKGVREMNPGALSAGGYADALIPEENILRLSFTDQDALETELKDFVSNVRNRTTPKVSGREGRRALAVVLQIIDQIREFVEMHKGVIENAGKA